MYLSPTSRFQFQRMRNGTHGAATPYSGVRRGEGNFMWTHRGMTQDGGGGFLSRNFFSSSVGYITPNRERNTNGMISYNALWCCQLQKIRTVRSRMLGLYSLSKYLHLMQGILWCLQNIQKQNSSYNMVITAANSWDPTERICLHYILIYFLRFCIRSPMTLVIGRNMQLCLNKGRQ